MSRRRRFAAATPWLPSRAAPQRSLPAPAHTAGSSRSPFQRPAQRIFLPPSRSGCSWRPRAPRLGGAVPGAAPPSAGGSSRCHFTPTSRRRQRRQLLLLNSRRSGGMKSSSPPPARAAALRSRRGGGDGLSARGPGAPPAPEGLALPRCYTHPTAWESARGGTVPRRRGCRPRVPPWARRQDGPLRPAPAPPASGVPSARRGERGAPAQRPVARGPVQPPSPCPALGRPRRVRPGRTGLSGEERGREGSCSAAGLEARESFPPGELCVCASLF